METNDIEGMKRQNAELALALRDAATKATPGEWYHVGGHDQRKAPFIRVVGDMVPGTMAVAQVCNRGSHSEYEANARWIATANPSAILALLDYIAALESSQAQSVPAGVPCDPLPDFSKFPTFAEYVAAKDQWRARHKDRAPDGEPSDPLASTEICRDPA